MLLAMRS